MSKSFTNTQHLTGLNFFKLHHFMKVKNFKLVQDHYQTNSFHYKTPLVTSKERINFKNDNDFSFLVDLVLWSLG